MSDKKPVLVMRTAERIHVLELMPADENGVHAIPTDHGYRYIGDTATAQVLKDGIEVTRWFAWTRIETHLGPFPNRVQAIKELLAWNGMYQVEPTATMSPLFEDEPRAI